MLCSSCGVSNRDGASICASCGRGLSARDFARGSVVAGRYEILSILGRGGMGVVYEARDRSLDELVAIKLIRADLADPDLGARFRGEIKLARRVRHRNVCSIFGDGEHEGRLFLCLERINGIDLKRELNERGPLRGGDAFRVAEQAAEGLGAIHAAGIIHRDIKTANLMRDVEGRIVLMDFGLARPSGAEVLDGVTRPGLVVGTPDYMSPEQARDEPLSPAADVYSLGIVVYELWTAERPFTGETPVSALVRRLSEPPPLERAVSLGLPRALVPVLKKALSIEPAERYPDGASLAAAIRAARAQFKEAGGERDEAAPSAPTLSAWTASARRPLLGRRAGAGLALALVVVLATFFSMRLSSKPTPVPESSAPPAIQTPLSLPGPVVLVGDRVDCLLRDRFAALHVRIPGGQKPSGRLYFKSNLSPEYFFTAIVEQGEEGLAFIPRVNPGGGIREITYYFSLSGLGTAAVAARTDPQTARIIDRPSECPPGGRIAQEGKPPGAVSVMSTVGQDLVLPIADAFGFQALLGGLKDPDPEVRLATAQSLGEMTALIVRVVDESALGLRSKAPTEREQAGNDLAVTARQAVRGTVEALVEGLRDGNPAIRRSVATTLGLLGRALAQARATLSDRLRDPDRDVRVSAARALAALGSAVTTTTVALRDAEEREEDEATLLALGKARQGIEDKLAAQKSRR